MDDNFTDYCYQQSIDITYHYFQHVWGDESAFKFVSFMFAVQQIDVAYSLRCQVFCKAWYDQELPSRNLLWHQFQFRHLLPVKAFLRVEDIQPKCKFARCWWKWISVLKIKVHMIMFDICLTLIVASICRRCILMLIGFLHMRAKYIIYHRQLWSVIWMLCATAQNVLL